MRTRTISVNPIIDWSDEDVWEFIYKQKLPYCKLYDEGFKRLGCIGCPMGGRSSMKKEFDRWPSYRNMYLEAFDKMLKARVKDGLKVKWKNAEEVMGWWLSSTSVRQSPGQINIKEIEQYK